MVSLYDKFYHIKCISCGQQYDEHETCTFCLKCGDPLDVIYNYDFIRQRLNLYALKNSPISALKYLTFYPIQNLDKIVTLNEGGTPLHKCQNLSHKYKLKNLYIKNEAANPTGVFKDRGTLVEVTKALEMGAKAICFASTGNMAASVAAYASIANIPCYVLVPEGTPIGKLAQTLSYGARIIQVRGSYSECAALAVEMSQKHGFYLAGDYAFRLEGQKSQAYEIAEQLGWKAPDYVICPVGCGTNLTAIWKGFKELHTLDLISKMPKIVAVQAEGTNVIVRAYRQKRRDFDVMENPQTVCSAACVGNPLDGKKALHAIYDTKGFADDVDDEAVLEAQQLMAKEEAIFVEPSGAEPMALVAKLAKKKFFKPEDMVVCIATGSGLKDPKSAVKILPDPPTIDPKLSEIDSYLKYKIYNIQSEGRKGRTKVLWKNLPTKPELKKIIKSEFGIHLNPEMFAGTVENIQAFATKGKSLTKQDLQNIIEEQLDEYAMKEKYLEVIDFTANTSKHEKAHAKIKINYGGKELVSEANGVGAVDAIISAIQTAIKKHDNLSMRLIDYNVEIFTGGVAAAVKVVITAEDKHGNRIIAQATSPDVIVASVTAFEKCYNFLYYKNH